MEAIHLYPSQVAALNLPLEFYPTSAEEVQLLSQPFTSLSEPEKEKIDRLLRSGALVLLPPQMSPETFYEISLDFQKIFSLEKTKTASASTILKNVALEEQKTISACLDKWIESLAEQAEENKKIQKKVTEERVNEQIQETAKYLKALAAKNQALSAVMVPLIIQAATVPTIFASKQDALGTVSALEKIVPMPTDALLQIAGISNGLTFAALSWAAPVAVTLGTFNSSPKEMEKTAVRAYAIATATFINNEEFTAYLESKIQTLVESGAISQDQAKLLLPSFKAATLIDGLASLYCSEYGGITKEELTALIDGSMKPSENTLLETFAKLVREQLDLLPSKERESLLNTCTSKYDYTTHQGLFEPIVKFLELWNKNYMQKSALSQPS